MKVKTPNLKNGLKRKGRFANAYPEMMPAAPRMRVNGEPSISTERVTQSIRMRFNPLRGLTPERLGQYLDQFDLGFFRMAAIAWDKIERRDPTLKSVAPKRKKAVARHGWDVLSIEGLEDSERELAAEQVKELKYFYKNLTCTNAVKPDECGGLRLLASQMMDGQSKYYAVHEVVWQPKVEQEKTESAEKPNEETTKDAKDTKVGQGAESRLTAQFVFCPLWWFEGTTGKLRYMESEFQVYGRDMEPGEWLVTCGEGLMEASCVAWMFKHLTMQDWLAYCEKFGTPFIDAATSASPGSEDWDALVEYVQNFGPDGGGVRSDTAKINPIEVKGTATETYSKMVENMNRALIILWRGGDLGTTSAKDQTGASLQGDESDILEGDDAVLIEETLEQQISRYVIAWKFGPDAPVLARLKFKQEQDPDAIQFQREVFKQFAADGTVVDVLANQTDLKKLVQDVGLPVNEKYVDPYLPVTDQQGREVTGELVTDSENDVIGAATRDGQGGEEKPEPGKESDLINETQPELPALEESGMEAYAAALAHDLQAVRDELEGISRIENDTIFTQRVIALADKLDRLKKDLLHLPKSAQVLAEVQIAALFTGLTEKQPSKSGAKT
jgi:Protein of unknown function (DUF935)